MSERDWRDYCLELVDEGLVDPRHMVLVLVKRMTREEVHDALDANELTPRFDEEEA